MPEGDTVHKIAAFMAPRLTGKVLAGICLGADDAPRYCGVEISHIEARGKHLWISLNNGKLVRSHLGMHGSWHVYGADEAWRKPRRQASLVVATAEDRYVCFNARDIEIVDAPGVRRRILDSRLGPDLITADIDPDMLVRRAREFDPGDALLIDALLDQRVAAGVGNVYKSEVLFLERLSPEQRLADVADATVAACYKTAATLLRRNLGGGKRVTRFADDKAGRQWVYGRTGLPCHECTTPIASRRMGRHHRATFWCAGCQTR